MIYLSAPGTPRTENAAERVTVTISGGRGVGKSTIAKDLCNVFDYDGIRHMLVDEHEATPAAIQQAIDGFQPRVIIETRRTVDASDLCLLSREEWEAIATLRTAMNAVLAGGHLTLIERITAAVSTVNTFLARTARRYRG